MITEAAKDAVIRSAQSAENIQHLWCRWLVGLLRLLDADQFVVSPGYRCAPILYALADHHQNSSATTNPSASWTTYSQMDERAAGYFALGLSKAALKLPVLVCTSGTAMANYLPAVLEAYNDRVPMVILTADRPFDLHDCGANQTINQPHLFGAYCEAELNLPEPSETISPQVLWLRIREVIATAYRSQRPVHINLPLREPLEPIHCPVSEEYLSQLTLCARLLTPDHRLASRACPDLGSSTGSGTGTTVAADGNSAAAFIREWQPHDKNWLIIVGSLPHHLPQKELIALATWLRKCDAPIYCDVTSAMSAHLADHLGLICDPEAPLLLRQLQDQLSTTHIIHLGDRITSGPILRALKHHSGEYLRLSPSALPYNPNAVIARQYCTPFSLALTSAAPASHPHWQHVPEPPQAENSLNLERRALAQEIVTALDPSDVLYLGNSSVIRSFNRVSYSGKKGLTIAANRGVSGIEGLVSSAKGYHQGSGRRVVLVLGDISFLYDLGALLDPYLTAKVKIIVFNDQRGSIFEQLPGKNHPGFINPLMTTPHNHTFANLLHGFPIKVRSITSTADQDTLASQLDSFLKADQPELLEILLAQSNPSG